MAPVSAHSKTVTIVGAQRPKADDSNAGTARTGRAASSVGADLKERAVRRLGVTAAALGAFVLIEGILSHAWEYTKSPDHYWSLLAKWDLLGVLVIVATSALAFMLLRSQRWDTHTRLRVGIGYLVCIAFFVSVTDHGDHFWRGGHGLHGVPALTIPILIFPVIVPMRWTTALAVGLAMAATGPLALFTLVAVLGYEQPSSSALLDSFPFLAAVCAAYLARIVHQLGVELRHAQQLGSYTLTEKLGDGGMGEVWRAEHKLLARPAAVKLILPELGDGSAGAAVDRFEREARTTSELKSPHTIEVYDFGVADDGRLYYVMELVDGIDLEQLVKTYGPQPPERVVHWLRQACHSLSEAHNRGLVHRDIKPANLMTCRYGDDYDFLKVLDFGLVTLGRSLASDDPRLTGHDRVIGTPTYLSPEMAVHGKADLHSDIYALGCVGYWLLAGEVVFTGDSAMEVIIKHVDAQPPSLSESAEQDIPAALEELIMACLEKDPADRPQSAAALSQALSECLAERSWSQDDARQWWKNNRTIEPTDPDPSPEQQSQLTVG